MITCIFLTSFEVPFPSFLGACNKQESEKEQNAMLLKFTLLHFHKPFPCYQLTCRKQNLFQNQTNAETTNSSKLIPILSQCQTLSQTLLKRILLFLLSPEIAFWYFCWAAFCARLPCKDCLYPWRIFSLSSSLTFNLILITILRFVPGWYFKF